jgi:uncharacterized protein (TIGR00156 family)
MRKLLAFTAIAALSLVFWPVYSAAQMGGFQGGFQSGSAGQREGGFSGPGLEVSQAAEASKLRDDSYVILRGNVIRQLGEDKYVFRDSSGEINLDIDRDKWRGQIVSPETVVEIKGEIDKDWNSVEVDVDRLVVVK